MNVYKFNYSRKITRIKIYNKDILLRKHKYDHKQIQLSQKYGSKHA